MCLCVYFGMFELSCWVNDVSIFIFHSGKQFAFIWSWFFSSVCLFCSGSFQVRWNHGCFILNYVENYWDWIGGKMRSNALKKVFFSPQPHKINERIENRIGSILMMRRIHTQRTQHRNRWRSCAMPNLGNYVALGNQWYCRPKIINIIWKQIDT